MYKLFLTLRYLFSRRIAYFAIAAVTLCTAMVLIVMSVMGGFLTQIKLKARGMLGDVIVDNRRYSGFPLYGEFIEEVSKWEEVVRATPVIYTFGLIRFSRTGQDGTVRIVGIHLNETYEVNGFHDGLYYERFYPGTTTLGEQRQPVMRMDISAGRDLPDGRFMPELVLPPDYAKALETARERARKNGKTLIDPDTWDDQENVLRRQIEQPQIPGYFAVDDQPSGYRGDPNPGLIIGRDIIAIRESDGRYKRSYSRGTPVSLTLWASSMSGNIDPIPIKQPFRYADDSRTGIYDIDSQHVYCDFELLQKLLQMNAGPRVDPDDPDKVIGTVPARCSQIQMKIKPGVNAEALCRKLEDAYRRLALDDRFDLSDYERMLVEDVEAMTWEQSQAHIIAPVEKERQLVTILFAIISLVAVALVLCILYMIVLQKTRDIGIVKAVGGSSAGVAAIFVCYGLAVGIVGATVGSVLGCTFVWKINEVQDWLIRVFGFRVWDLKVYSFDRIPSEVDPADLIAVVLFAVCSATIGSLAAAWRAGNMQPVEALRFE